MKSQKRFCEIIAYYCLPSLIKKKCLLRSMNVEYFNKAIMWADKGKDMGCPSFISMRM